MGTQQFSLRWNNYLRHITSAFDSLRTDKDLVDVTLSCEGKKIKAHKMLLSACSSYFKDLFKDNPCQHPVVIFRNVKFEDLDALVNFMYQGEVNVLQEQLASFLTTAELLEVQGLTDGGTNPEEEEELETEIVPPPPVPQREFRPEKRRSQPQSSNETMSPVSFIPINKRPESPLTKRRKFLSSSSSMKPSEKDTESRRHAQQQQQQQQQLSSPDPVEVIPVVPNVKIEKPEYYESDQGGGEYSDSMHASNSNQEMTDMSEHGHLDSKQEAVDIYEDSGDSSHLEGLSDLSSILSKPGTSVESVSQESLHGTKGPKQMVNAAELHAWHKPVNIPSLSHCENLTDLLIHIVTQPDYLSRLKDKTTRKKDIWLAVARQMEKFGYPLSAECEALAAEKCNQKLRNLKKTYYKFLNDSQQGFRDCGKITVPKYLSQLPKLFGTNPDDMYRVSGNEITFVEAASAAMSVEPSELLQSVSFHKLKKKPQTLIILKPSKKNDGKTQSFIYPASSDQFYEEAADEDELD